MTMFARFILPALVATAVSMAAGSSFAAKVHNTYGSPLDTLMNTRLKTDVPEAKDFVKATSPDKRDLDYTPLTDGAAPDPVRPKPRDARGIEALQAELASAGARNARRAKGLTSAAH